MGKLGQKISAIARNKEAKTVAGNFMWLSLLQVAGYVFPLITMPYLARVIGVEGFGKIAFAAAVMLWIQIFSEWGFNQSATRDVAQNRDNPNKVSEIFSNVLWARLLLMSVAFVVLIALIILIPKFRTEYDVLLVTFLLIPGHIFFPDWFFQAIEKMRYISILNIIIKLFFTLAVFVFIKKPSDYIFQPLFISLGYILCGIISMYFILIKWKIKITRPNLQTIITYIRNSTDIFINNITPNLYNSFSQVLLGITGGSVANGIYEGGNKFYSILSNLLHIFIRTFFPFLSRRPEKHKYFVIITLSVTAFAVIFLYLVAPWITQIMLSSEFGDSVIIIRILSISLFFAILYNCYGMCYLIIHRREKILRKITLYTSIFGFIISWPLIYKFSYLGAAYTVFISRFLLGITTLITAKYLQFHNRCDDEKNN